MAMMLGSLYKALLAAQVPEEDARRAAEEVAGYETRLAAIEARLLVLTWMIGAVLGLVFLVLGKVW